jgi:NitT/TauT family transport system ATP-binding protein
MDTIGSSRIAFGKSSVDCQVSCRFPAPTGVLFEDFALSLINGTVVCIVGASGCGKTTLLNLLGGVISKPSLSGTSSSRVPISYAFHRPRLLPWHDVIGNALLEIALRNVNRPEDYKEVDELIRILGLANTVGLRVEHFSSGMAQRLQFVRCAATLPGLLLLDEPLGAVDQPTRVRVAPILANHFREKGVTVLWVTHDIVEAQAAADRILVLGSRPVKVLLDLATEIRRDPTGGSPTSGSVSGNSLTILEKLSAIEPRELVAPVDAPLEFITPFRTLGLPIIPLLVFLIGWEGIIRLFPSFHFFFPRPSEWIPAIWNGLVDGSLTRHAIATLRRALAGMGVAVLTGVPLGLLSSLRPAVGISIRPWLAGLSVIPLFVLGPAFILWFGVGDEMKVAVAAATAIPMVALMTLDSATSLKDDHLRYLLNSGAPLPRIIQYMLAPGLFWFGGNGFRLALLAALLGAFMGEIIASENGLGYYVVLNASRYRMDLVFAGLSVFLAIAWISELLAWRSMRVLGRRVGQISKNDGAIWSGEQPK